MPAFYMRVLYVFFCLLGPICATAVESIQLVGAGAPSLPINRDALFSYRFVDPNVQSIYNSIITGDAALCRLMNYSKECSPTDTALPLYLDWASTVNIPTTSMYQRYPDLQVYPTSAFGIAPLYNLNGVSNLVLSVQTLAKIWSGRITTWDHPEIVASNPNFMSWNIPANQSIQLAARGDTIGATLVLKKVMHAVDPTFSATAASWGGLVKPVVYASGSGLVSYVFRTPYTMGYAAPADAEGLAPMVKLNRSGTIVECNSGSVQYAVLEKGLSFGNNGDDPQHLTSDISNALNPLAWPFVLWGYIAVRKATLRPGASCTTVATLADFWLWFWYSTEVATLIEAQHTVALPEVVRDQVVARFKTDLYCGGQRVWREADPPVVSGYGAESATPVFDKFQQAYALVNSSVTLNYTALVSDQADVSAMLRAGGYVVSTASSTAAGTCSLVLGSEAVVAISTVSGLVLDGLTLAKILNGDITTWLHPDIVALNPGGLRANGKVLNNTAQRIVLLQGPTSTSAALTALLRQYYPAYTGAAVQAAERFPREALLWSGVIGSPFAFSVTALVGTLPTELQPAALVAGGLAVAPSLATAWGCTSGATYNAASKAVALAPAGNVSCYPLLLTLYVSVQRQCPAPATAARTVAFLKWMFTADTLAAALDALNLASLNGVAGIKDANEEALFWLSCQVLPVPATSTNIVPLLLAIIIPIGIVVLLGLAACGWWLWRVTEYNRMLRKKFSNDNVAERCAEAIARFDLASVAWLKEVKEPNKIQLAFLAIIGLLTEVKPYIPDQLLSRLMVNETDAKAEEGDDEVEQRSVASSPAARRSGREVQPREQVLASSLRASTSSQPPSPSSSRRNLNRRVHQSIASSEGVKQMSALKDWRRQRCTYMCVRFGSASQQPERRLPALVEVVGRIVDVAKAHGATIDAVGVEFVNVHWGVASASGAALRAIQAGLEMAKLRDTLPADQREEFWLQAGVGKGLCDCGTVSSESGHRFFVVWGAEPALALHIAMAGLPQRVLASLLVSPAVHDEVQYTVECMPRLYHGDLLLWEPRFVLRKGDDDEWMYELKKMSDGAALTSKALLDVFLLARDKKAVAELPARIAELRRSHGGTMTPQDTASLELLLAAPRP